MCLRGAGFNGASATAGVISAIFQAFGNRLSIMRSFRTP